MLSLIILDFDECQFSPCQNNGTCVNTVGSYICDCTTGWKDQNCLNGKKKYIKINSPIKTDANHPTKTAFFNPPPPPPNKSPMRLSEVFLL